MSAQPPAAPKPGYCESVVFWSGSAAGLMSGYAAGFAVQLPLERLCRHEFFMSVAGHRVSVVGCELSHRSKLGLSLAQPVVAPFFAIHSHRDCSRHGLAGHIVGDHEPRMAAADR